jgi:predicted transcriptional regulator
VPDAVSMRSITLAIPDATAAKLAELARRQYRAPRQQAAALLVEEIERAWMVAQTEPVTSDVGRKEPLPANESRR